MPGSVNTADEYEYEFINYEEVVVSPEDVAKVRDWLKPTDYLADSVYGSMACQARASQSRRHPSSNT
ncbi:hypothetical protein V2G26_004677 [Clonostachys chloroleuca]